MLTGASRGRRQRQPRHRPATLAEAGATRRLAGLGVDELLGQRVLRRAAATRHGLRPGGAAVLVAVQPGAHDVLTTAVDGGDLGDAVAAGPRAVGLGQLNVEREARQPYGDLLSDPQGAR